MTITRDPIVLNAKQNLARTPFFIEDSGYPNNSNFN
jgi:hypothetical protein